MKAHEPMQWAPRDRRELIAAVSVALVALIVLAMLVSAILLAHEGLI